MAVPKSIDRSLENMPRSFLNIFFVRPARNEKRKIALNVPMPCHHSKALIHKHGLKHAISNSSLTE
ncbi:Uncharacterised protein [Vibrio cholerae]|nr:Uncharacterised protein [Vibrio cholerae]